MKTKKVSKKIKTKKDLDKWVSEAYFNRTGQKVKATLKDESKKQENNGIEVISLIDLLTKRIPALEKRVEKLEKALKKNAIWEYKRLTPDAPVEAELYLAKHGFVRYKKSGIYTVYRRRYKLLIVEP